MNAQPLSWLKHIQDELHLAKEIPLWGSPPDFPWKNFAKELQKSLQIPDLEIILGKKEFCIPEEFLHSFGKKPIIKTLEFTPLPGEIYLILSSESLEKITMLLLSQDDDAKNFADLNLQEGFYEYLLLCGTDSFSKISPYQDLHIQWLETKHLPSTASFSLDLSLSLKDQKFLARLIFSPPFHKAFINHFAKNLKTSFDSPLASLIEVPLKIEAGCCSLPKADWDRLKIGDFLVLDTCSYDPFLGKGTVTLSLETHALFQVKLKKGKLKILDYCTHYGDKHTMDDDMEIDSLFPDEEEDVKFDDLEKQEKPPIKEILSASSEISFPIVVEIDRLHMPLKKLLALEPGNILELPIQPEQGVYLTVHGKKIAKGELIKLGDAIGVKIIELGEPSLL